MGVACFLPKNRYLRIWQFVQQGMNPAIRLTSDLPYFKAHNQQLWGHFIQLQFQIFLKQMSHLLQPTILLLRDGTDTMQGIGQIISNINAVEAVVDIVKSTLGPRGMDKMITTAKDTTISNDGATILKLLDIEHAAAKILVDIAKSQDNEVGDGTTTVTILAGQLLKNAKGFIEDGMNPQIVIRGYKQALEFCLNALNSLVIQVNDDPKERRNMLIRCAETALNSKLLSSYKQFFAEIVVSAVEKLDTNLLDKELIGIKEVTGGSINDSFLVSGVAFKKTFSYAGFEQQPKKFINPKIIILKIQLELKSEKENAEIRINNVDDFQSIVDAEWQIIYEKLQKIHDVGAQIVLSKLPIGDLATQWFADRGIFCAGRIPQEDLYRITKATGATLQTTVNNVTPDVLGTCGRFEEKQIGAERYNLFEECPNTKSATIILRGGAQQFIKEAERSLNDAIMIVRRCFKTNKVVAGGGATEMELSKRLKEHSVKISGKEQLVMNMFAKALEIIPRIIADNAGLDSLDLINKLRNRHHKGGEENIYVGIDINSGVGDNKLSFVWEPLLVKVNALKAATEAACTILSIDETVRNPKSEQEEQQRRIKKSIPTAGRR